MALEMMESGDKGGVENDVLVMLIVSGGDDGKCC